MLHDAPMRPATAFFAAAILLTACSSADDSDGEAADNALRTDPNATVSTIDETVQLLSGYNAFLDRSTTTKCVVANGDAQVNVGQVQGQLYLRQVTTKEELAKELDIDVSASLKVPKVGVDAGTKLVNTFKRSATTASFVVRAVQSYSVTNKSELALTDAAKTMLSSNTNEFLQKCGGSFASGVRYEAQVVGLMQFEAQTEEQARQIATSLGVSGNAVIKQIGNATADLKTKSEQTASSANSTLSLTVVSSGFRAKSGVEGVTDHTFEKIDQLRNDMSASVEDDVKRDRDGYFANNSRNVRAVEVTQATYAQLSNAPGHADYTRLTSTLTRAEEFYNDVSKVTLRMQNVYTDEVAVFLSDTKNQFRYNLVKNPKTSTTDLVPIAQDWEKKFEPTNGTLVEPLRGAIDRCLAAAGNGDYSACVTDPHLDGAKSDGERALGDYADKGRIVVMQTWMPTLGATMSYRYAEPACDKLFMRLPTRAEAPFIAPAVTALAGPKGEVWIAGDAQCPKPVYQNNSGQGTFTCDDGAFEGLPYVGDRPVLCVSKSGPVAAMPSP
jgi:hypothetical protein